MIKQILILLISISLFYACANNDKKANSDKSQKGTIDTITKFYPEKYEEEVIDTIVDDNKNLRVIIKKATRMNKFITQEFELDSLHFQRINYRDKTLEFKVIENNKVIFDKTITKEDLSQIKDKDFLSKSIMYGAYFDKYDKQKQEVIMIFSIIVPDTDWGYFYTITVDKSGDSKILEQIENDEDF